MIESTVRRFLDGEQLNQVQRLELERFAFQSMDAPPSRTQVMNSDPGPEPQALDRQVDTARRLARGSTETNLQQAISRLCVDLEKPVRSTTDRECVEILENLRSEFQKHGTKLTAEERALLATVEQNMEVIEKLAPARKAAVAREAIVRIRTAAKSARGHAVGFGIILGAIISGVKQNLEE